LPWSLMGVSGEAVTKLAEPSLCFLVQKCKKYLSTKVKNG
jgi:hypothetical protein